MKPLLEIKNLSVEFITEGQRTKAIENVSLTINQGEIVALVGESGSGKSVTSLSLLQLLPTPPAVYTTGQLFFTVGEQTIDLLQCSPKALQEIRGNKIAMIFQEPMTSLNPVIQCGKQVTEVLIRHQTISETEAKKITLEWFEKVRLPKPAELYYRYPHELSGGQKQRVMIAMAMCCHPQLLICDEPTTALDVTVQKNVLELIQQLQREQNMGVLFITHALALVAEFADRAVIMYKGTIVEQNTVENLFKHPKAPYTKALLACRPALYGKGERLPVVQDFLTDTKENTLPTTVVKKVDDLKEPVIEVTNLSVSFPTKKNLFGTPIQFYKAVDDVSFCIYKGETLGLVGESGCGKTTLGRTLLHLVKPDSGTILFENKDITTFNKQELKDFRRAVQLVFQDPFSSLNPRLTVGEAIAEPMAVVGNRKKADRLKAVAELLNKVNLPASYAKRYPHEFSGGQRQRIVIARALALQPLFLVCDESVSALDVSIQAQVLNLLNDLKKEFNLTLLFISHDLSVVRYMCDRIMVMKQGAIIEQGDAEQVYHNPQSAYTKKLLAAIPHAI